MMMIYGLMDRNLIFAKDSQYTKTANNHKDYDTVASATYSSKGVFNYVLSACKQYVNTDKANLVGGNA